MQDPLATEAELVAALKLTVGPPQAWVEAAVLLPSTLGDLQQIERAVASPAFRERFERDPLSAVADAGLNPSDGLVSALRDRLSD
jgi:hypothetical protein